VLPSSRVIGHVKAEHRMGRNYLVDRHGDATNAILAAVGYDFSRLIAWLTALFCLLRITSLRPAVLSNSDNTSELCLQGAWSGSSRTTHL
jgi:hypothetical protein